MQILDRRLNPRAKPPQSARFLAARPGAGSGARRLGASAWSADAGWRKVSIPPQASASPPSSHPAQGARDHVLPGNKEYREGDEIQRPPGGGGRGGPGGCPDGSGDDTFRFVLSREEFLALFLDDLELPDMASAAWSMAPTRSAPRRLLGDRLAGQPLRCPAPCGTACRAGSRCGARSPKRSRRWRPDRRAKASRTPSASDAAAEELERQLRGPPHPLYRPDRRPLPALRALPARSPRR